MAEVIRISFDVSGNGFDTIRTHDQVMKFRGWAVHPPAEQTAPVLHPDINRGVEWRFVAFRYSNAVTTVRIALSLANQLVMKPKIKFSCPRRLLREYEKGIGTTRRSLVRGIPNHANLGLGLRERVPSCAVVHGFLSYCFA